MSTRDFAAQLRAWRAARQLAQAQAAAALGTPVGTLRDWEQGREIPRDLTREAIQGKLLAVTPPAPACSSPRKTSPSSSKKNSRT